MIHLHAVVPHNMGHRMIALTGPPDGFDVYGSQAYAVEFATSVQHAAALFYRACFQVLTNRSSNRATWPGCLWPDLDVTKAFWSTRCSVLSVTADACNFTKTLTNLVGHLDSATRSLLVVKLVHVISVPSVDSK
jgi:hypothetical protein